MTGIFIITYNTPSEVFLLQVEAINKFCRDKEFKIEVFDNSRDGYDNVWYHSQSLGVGYTRLITKTTDPSQSHAFAANIAYSLKGELYDCLFYLDHDCIPVKEFCVDDLDGSGYLGAGIGQQKSKTYFWPGCFMLVNKNIDKDLVNFSISREHGLDTGGELYKLIEEYGKNHFIFFGEAYEQNPNYKGKYDFYSIIDGRFMHFINGSNWNGVKDNEERLNSLINIARNKIDNNE